MSDSPSAASPSISLDDLVALNDEIGALVRAGVPLDVGLRGFALLAPRRLADLSGRLADSLSGGRSLTEALDSQGVGMPRVYRFVIESGRRAGRLPQAMETLSAYARNLLDVRRRIGLSIIYPCIVLVAAYYLFWYFIGGLSAGMADIAARPGKPASFWFSVVQSAHEAVRFLGHIPPMTLGVLWFLWEASSRLTSRAGGIAGIGLRWVPGLTGGIRLFRQANFADLAAVMTEHDVPAPEAFRLAAEATGDRRTIGDADQIAARIGRGEPLEKAIQSAMSLPPFMRWMIQSGVQHDALPASLRQVADIYRRRANLRFERFSFWFPTLATLIVGGGAVLIYTTMLFAPLGEIFKSTGLD